MKEEGFELSSSGDQQNRNRMDPVRSPRVYSIYYEYSGENNIFVLT